MFVLRKEILEALSKSAVESFEDRMVDHLKKSFPNTFAELGEFKIREMIQHGTDRAESYNIIGMRDIANYIDLQFALGRDFDVNPRMPWAQRILSDPEPPEEKINRLYRYAKRFLEEQD